MPVVLDVEVGKREGNLETGIALDLDERQRETVVLTKFISNNPVHADWQPSGEWYEETTSDVGRGKNPRIIVGKRAASIDDGLIIQLVGTMSGLVGILPGQPPMSESQVEAYQDATEQPVPMFQQWDFRIKSILRTNGPEARQALSRSEDQKRKNAQTEMFEAFTKMFQTGQKEAMAQGDVSPSAEKALTLGAAVGGKK